MTLLCCLFSFLNPVLLLNAYEGAKERTKSMAKSMDVKVVQQMENFKNIKHQWVTFINIELGKIKLLNIEYIYIGLFRA